VYHGLMGIWFSAPKLAPEETISLQVAANTFKGKRMIGGQITVTNKRLIFRPNRLDGALGGNEISLKHVDITGIQLSETGLAGIKKYGLGASIHSPVNIAAGNQKIAITVKQPDLLIQVLHDEGVVNRE